MLPTEVRRVVAVLAGHPQFLAAQAVGVSGSTGICSSCDLFARTSRRVAEGALWGCPDLCRIISDLLNDLEYARWPRIPQPRTSRQCCRSQHLLSLHFNATLLATDVAAMGAGRLLPSTPALLALPSPFLDQNLDRIGAFDFIPGTHHVPLHPCTHSAFSLNASMYPYIRSSSRCTILPTPFPSSSHPSSSHHRRPLSVTTPSIK